MASLNSTLARGPSVADWRWPLGWPLWCMLCSSLLLWPAAGAQGQSLPRWQLWHSDQDTGTQVWLRARGEQVPAFRASTRLSTRLSALVAVVLDTEHMPEWVYRAAQVRRLDSPGPTQGVWQIISHMPWPLTDREVVMRWELSQEKSTGMVTLRGLADPERLPAPVGMVRMPSLASTWRFIPLPDGEVQVQFEGHGDPGGNMGLPLLRLFVDAAMWHAPLRTVNGLRLMVERPEYRDARLPFVQEPKP